MTADSQWELQQAIYTALIDDVALGAIVANRIFSVIVPQDSDFPYVVIGETSPAQWDTKDTDGMEQSITIHSWSRVRSASEIMQIMGAIVDALDSVSLSVTDHTLVDLRYVNGIGPLQDPDGNTMHGVQRFNALTQSTTGVYGFEFGPEFA